MAQEKIGYVYYEQQYTRGKEKFDNPKQILKDKIAAYEYLTIDQKSYDKIRMQGGMQEILLKNLSSEKILEFEIIHLYSLKSLQIVRPARSFLVEFPYVGFMEKNNPSLT